MRLKTVAAALAILALPICAQAQEQFSQGSCVSTSYSQVDLAKTLFTAAHDGNYQMVSALLRPEATLYDAAEGRMVSARDFIRIVREEGKQTVPLQFEIITDEDGVIVVRLIVDGNRNDPMIVSILSSSGCVLGMAQFDG